ncbi:DUF871 domain-containing protein [Enterococcus sp. BWB1-3]|uniref:DUF871 domain-containing protein n=1 Tax=unclassified Enterococcus TaxID=2608891 RepID=UPI001920C653|nr:MULTISPECIES: MupG family TIM beta-alpha barrel fold protein [unclassified Enterococcus]MBL1229861.1 DUF871 domain-containing protein [Enterococcus sp. BWB1-3]MCB5951377.1 MupG family TIM beta-alpha barrel fold protein [Enterococcus sp. BWT-B8]MCB5954932.1 MupG family TIM beta-alpha barrel fold protein [Enterococcus sp. CWB-B31]
MTLGISIYPEKTTQEKDQAYIDLAYQLGYRRIFTSLLELAGDEEQVINNFKETVQYASNLGMEVMVDINPKIFSQIGVSYEDLSFFSELGAYGIRLDMGFTGREEAEMTRNAYNLKIEVNMSIGTKYIDNIMSFSPNKKNLVGSHNFYPMEYSGLDEGFYKACCQQFKNYSLETAAFITSKNAILGPWPLQDGLCTLEQHRNQTIRNQAQYYVLDEAIDTIIIGDAYASEQELAEVSEVYFATHPQLQVVLENNIQPIEKKIVLEEKHSYRGDRSAFLLRSSLPRFKYREESIAATNCPPLKRGDIVIGNNNFGQYKAELHIVLQDIPNNKQRCNLVGHLTEESLDLLPKLKAWSKFKLVQ